MSSKLLHWVLRNISQSYSWNIQKAAIFGLFSILSNNVLQFEGNFLKFSSPYWSPLSAMASKSYGWDLRNVAKSFLKMTKKGQLWTSSILFKNCPKDSNEKFTVFSSSCQILICAMALNLYGWHSRNIAKSTPKLFWFFFSIFSNTVLAVRTKVYTVFLHHIGVLYVQWHQSRIAGIREPNPKWPRNCQLCFFPIVQNGV